MLIYVNQFDLVGEDSSDVAFQTVAGWLKNITKRHFTIEQLKSGEEFSIGRAKVRTYIATVQEPLMYSILFSHPDRAIRGRQWITEIGIKIENYTTTISILLETSDISTLVREIPTTTRPLLVKFLRSNASFSNNTVGLKVNHFENSTDSFKALSYEIEREKRLYPIVLISNEKDTNKPLVSPDDLQEQLLGLAQVLHSEEEINSWQLEDVLSRQYSAWDGAINIIYPLYGRKYCYTRLLPQGKIKEIISSGENITQSILSFITHTTNGFNKKRHFSPTDVRAKRQRDLRLNLKIKFEKLSNNNGYQELAEEAFQQLEEQENVIEQLKNKYQDEMDEQLLSHIELEESLDKLQSEKYALESKIDGFNYFSKEGKPILIYGSENDLYNGEILDTVLQTLKKSMNDFQDNSRNKQRV